MFITPGDLGEIKFIHKTERYISNVGYEVSRKLSKDVVSVVCIGATIGKVGITVEDCTTNQQINSNSS